MKVSRRVDIKSTVISRQRFAYLGKLLPLCSSWPSSTGSASFFTSSFAAVVLDSAAGVSVVSLATSVSVVWADRVSDVSRLDSHAR